MTEGGVARDSGRQYTAKENTPHIVGTGPRRQRRQPIQSRNGLRHCDDSVSPPSADRGTEPLFRSGSAPRYRPLI